MYFRAYPSLCVVLCWCHCDFIITLKVKLFFLAWINISWLWYKISGTFQNVPTQKMVASKRYGRQKKCPQKWRTEKENCCCLINSQVHNKLPSVLFKRTSYTDKKKWLKVRKTTWINKIFLVLRKVNQNPSWKRCPQISSEYDTAFVNISMT